MDGEDSECGGGVLNILSSLSMCIDMFYNKPNKYLDVIEG